jgi:hypothetical protein
MLEAANATIDQIIARTAVQLHAHRAQGGCDSDFVEQMMRDFHTEALKSPLGAGSKHMALSVYRMVWQQDLLRELSEKVAMRDAALEMMFSLEQM